MKDNSKTRKLLADLRRLHKDVRCEEHRCECCQGISVYCDKCRQNCEINEKARYKIKEQLKNLPHIPNKKEAKQLRQKKAKQRK